MHAAEYNHVGVNSEDQDEYKAGKVSWEQKEARWSHLYANANQSTIGKIVHDAVVVIYGQANNANFAWQQHFIYLAPYGIRDGPSLTGSRSGHHHSESRPSGCDDVA